MSNHHSYKMTTWQSLPAGVVGGLWVDGVSSFYSPNPEKNQFATIIRRGGET